MAELLNSETFGDRIYDRFPEVYKREDQYQNFALKRYLKVAGVGYKTVIDEYNGIADLRDSDRVRSDLLPVIYTSHGLDIFRGIPEDYLRNLVYTINPCFARKGSVSSIEFLCSVTTGIQCNVDVSEFDKNNFVNIYINMDYAKKDKLPSVEQLKRIAESFLPFYCTFTVSFLYVFYDSFAFALRDKFHFDEIDEERNSSLGIVVDELFEEEVDSDTNDNSTLYDNRHENSCFLNNARLTLNNNIYLNSLNGYDTIIKNGTKIISTYNN